MNAVTRTGRAADDLSRTQDGFLHFSTEPQLSGTLSRFFVDVPAVTLLKCDYARLSAWKVVSWEASSTDGA